MAHLRDVSARPFLVPIDTADRVALFVILCFMGRIPGTLLMVIGYFMMRVRREFRK